MIRLLVVDDSPLMRRLLAEIFAEAGDFELAFARDGAEALALLPAFRPDVVTLDVQMPGMDGLTCLDQIMVQRPCPVVMVSALTESGAQTTLEALSLGAVDFVAKPTGAISMKIHDIAPGLVATVRAAAQARVSRAHRLTERVRLRNAAPSRPRRGAGAVGGAPPPGRRAGDFDRVVLIGCSTGGPPALDAVLAPLPADFPWPILVAQHMPASFTGALARRLDNICALNVLEVAGSVALAPGRVYIARGDADLIVGVRPAGAIALPAPAQPDLPWHPSVDRLVDSAITHLGAERLVGILMTGMGHDGAAAMGRVRAGGGRTIAEAQSTAVVWGMPGELVRSGGAEFVAPLGRICARLQALRADA